MENELTASGLLSVLLILFGSSDAIAQAVPLNPSFDSCTVLERKRTRGDLRFTVHEAYVFGAVEQWLGDHNATLSPADGWDVLNWLEDYCRKDPSLTLNQALGKMIYEKLALPLYEKP